MLTQESRQAAESLMQRCLSLGVRLALAESCTGGLIAAAITAVPGASQVLDRGFVTYSNESKEQELDVPRALCDQFGAVSEVVAVAMAKGALQRARGHAQLGIAVTGVAGPDDSPAKPAGLVHIAVARLGSATVWHERHEFGAIGRDAVREKTVVAALGLALQCLDGS